MKKIISSDPIRTMEKEKSVEELFKREPAIAEPTGLKTKFEQVAEKLKEDKAAVGMEEIYPLSSFLDEPAIPPMAPVHIDLEMEDSADPVEITAKADPEDYTDPEWFDRPILS